MSPAAPVVQWRVYKSPLDLRRATAGCGTGSRPDSADIVPTITSAGALTSSFLSDVKARRYPPCS